MRVRCNCLELAGGTPESRLQLLGVGIDVEPLSELAEVDTRPGHGAKEPARPPPVPAGPPVPGSAGPPPPGPPSSPGTLAALAAAAALRRPA